MLKYVDVKVVFAEIPDAITLAINISNCPCHCKGCHSSYLSKDIGSPLNNQSLEIIVDKNQGCDCLVFMGGDANPDEISRLAKFIRQQYPYLKVAWYSGRQELPHDINLEYFDYIKLGPYIPENGGLKSPSTNQRFYKIQNGSMLDETFLFWK